jgi:predicted acyltransferase
LPVIAGPLRWRVAFGVASGLLHLGLSYVFWYDLLHAKKVIDGGPLGFLTWTLPVIAGSVAYDWRKGRGPGGSLRPLLLWGAVLMLVGYALSCLGRAGPLAAPPFWPPRGSVDLWTMSQRAGSLSYQTFASGLSLALYAGFVWACDLRAMSLGIFTVFGQNALAAYLLHMLLEVPFSPLRQKEAPPWQALGVIALFLAANAVIVALLNRRGWFLRL